MSILSSTRTGKYAKLSFEYLKSKGWEVIQHNIWVNSAWKGDYHLYKHVGEDFYFATIYYDGSPMQRKIQTLPDLKMYTDYIDITNYYWKIPHSERQQCLKAIIAAANKFLSLEHL